MERDLKIAIKFFTVLILIAVPYIGLGTAIKIYIDSLPDDKGPFLQWFDDPRYSISVLWETSEPIPTVLKIGGTPDNLPIVFSDNRTVKLHIVNVTGLKPDTVYYYSIYKITDGKITESKVYSFKTAPEGNTPFNFTVFGDSRENNPFMFNSFAADRVVSAMSTENPNFILSVGDIWYTGNDKGTVKLFFKNMGDFPAYRPFISALGNHEITRGRDFYLRYIIRPNSYNNYTYYFGLNYSDTHFTFMAYPYTCYQSGEVKGNWLNTTQLEWLEKDLAANTGKRWRIVVIHSPVKSSAFFGEDYKAQKYLLPIFEKYNVSCVFMGSDHIYEHLRINGIDYIVTGGGGADLGYIGSITENTVKYAAEYHYLFVKIDETSINITAKTYDGRILENIEIK